jgi:hypothetical protein
MVHFRTLPSSRFGVGAVGYTLFTISEVPHRYLPINKRINSCSEKSALSPHACLAVAARFTRAVSLNAHVMNISTSEVEWERSSSYFPFDVTASLEPLPSCAEVLTSTLACGKTIKLV